ncbi:MAG: hypothetical protein ACKOVB_06435 [Terrabacter sp.]
MTIDDIAVNRSARPREPSARRVLRGAGRIMSHLASRPLLIGSTALFVVCAGVFFASTAPFAIPRVESLCHQAPLDMRFTSTADQVASFLRECGTTGRDAYQHLQVADLIYPAVFGLFMATAIAFVLSRLAPARDSILALAALPLVASAFDYLENVCAWLALRAYPAPTSTNALLGLASAAKNVTSWTAGSVLVGALVMLALRAVGLRSRRLRRRRVELPSPRGIHQ